MSKTEYNCTLEIQYSEYDIVQQTTCTYIKKISDDDSFIVLYVNLPLKTEIIYIKIVFCILVRQKFYRSV